MTPKNEETEQSQFLTFRLADGTYAVSILRVKEITEYGAVTRVPNLPASIRGVINLRGAVVPVVDMVKRFKLGESSVTKRTCIIIAEYESAGEARVMGLMADSVSQVIDLPSAEIEPPPSFGTAIRVDFLQGLGKLGKEFVLILDLDRVLSLEEILVATVAQNAASESPEPGEERHVALVGGPAPKEALA